MIVLGQILGIVGALMMLVGVFAPMLSVPLWGGINLFRLLPTLALLLLVIAGAHIVFCVRRLWWGLWITKGMLILAVLFTLYEDWDRITGRTSFLEGVVGDMVQPVIKVHWGVAVLIGGILLTLAASLPRLRKKVITPAPLPPQDAAEEHMPER